MPMRLTILTVSRICNLYARKIIKWLRCVLTFVATAAALKTKLNATTFFVSFFLCVFYFVELFSFAFLIRIYFTMHFSRMCTTSLQFFSAFCAILFYSTILILLLLLFNLFLSSPVCATVVVFSCTQFVSRWFLYYFFSFFYLIFHFISCFLLF